MDEREPERIAYHVEMVPQHREEFEMLMGDFAERHAPLEITYIEEPLPEPLSFPPENRAMVTMWTLEDGREVPIVTRKDLRSFYQRFYAEMEEQHGEPVYKNERLPDATSEGKLSSVLYSTHQNDLQDYQLIDRVNKKVIGIPVEKIHDLLHALQFRYINIPGVGDKVIKVLELFVEKLDEPPQDE